jgi:zinc protease
MRLFTKPARHPAPKTLAALALSMLAATFVASACKTTEEKGQSAARREPPSEPWRMDRPIAGEPPEMKLPVFHKTTLKSGLTLIVVEDKSLPLLRASVVVRAGSADETAKEAGLAHLAFDLVDEGAGTYNRAALATAFADIGAEVQTGAGAESGSVSVRLLKKHADAGLELLSLVVAKPTFANDDVERIKKLHIAQLQSSAGDPRQVASTTLAREAYGADHPYGHDDNGTAQTLQSLTAARVKKFWADKAGPKNAALVLVGDVSVDEAKALGEKHFAKWKGTGKQAPAPKAPKARTATRIVIVDFPGAPQTVVRVARPFMVKGDPDEAAAILFNQVLGGMFSSRLNLKLREEKQWTYGAGSFVNAQRGPGLFGAGSNIQTPHTAEAVKEIVNQLDVLKTGGITDEELQLAKDNHIKSLPGIFGINAVLPGVASELFVYGLPVDHYSTELQKVQAVTGEDVKRVAERAIQQSELVIVLVGDRAQIEAGVKELGIGDVVVLDKDGKPVG